MRNHRREPSMNDLTTARILFTSTGGRSDKNQHGKQSGETHFRTSQESELYRFHVPAIAMPLPDVRVLRVIHNRAHQLCWPDLFL
jgi:hypothetical protein